ncbi:HIRAN domain-containing protein [Ekhidna lutea]|uniref:HIRAN domain-containing protein n=1 Tax=Ekhidna lutea TaxID=447679 RepID=A0A239LC56_EKHLU|nr:HIRAN domain-containing protein [Ekhidna lutea]SNT28237.1 HIRAN domain-containing protein [Ekhidna lutea]
MAKIIKIPSVFVYETKVVGVSLNNADGSSRQEIIKREVAEDDKLQLEAEPTNPYDSNAVQVLSKNGNQIGYLNKEMAETIKPALDNQTEIHVTAKWVNGEKMLGVGLRIELVS